MQVRYINDNNRIHLSLGKIYEVIKEQDAYHFLILNDLGRPSIYQKKLFALIGNETCASCSIYGSNPKNCICRRGTEEKKDYFSVVWVGQKLFKICYSEEDEQEYLEAVANERKVLVLKITETYSFGKKQ